MSRYQLFLPRSTIRVRAQDDKEQTAWAGGSMKSFWFLAGSAGSEGHRGFLRWPQPEHTESKTV